MGVLGVIEACILVDIRKQVIPGVAEAGAVQEDVDGDAPSPALATLRVFAWVGVAGGRSHLELVVWRD